MRELEEKRQAGAETEIEVTPEMIEAVARILENQFDALPSIAEDQARTIVLEVLRRRAGFPEPALSRESLAAMRELEEKPSQWHEGTALGSVVGELRKLDDFEHDREFVIVPAVGDPVFCKFPPSMDDEMGGYWRKIVKVSGVLHYKASSPFPESVDVSDGGIELYATTRPRRTLREMRGVFAGRERAAINWGDLLDG